MTFEQDENETPVIFRKSRRKEPGGRGAEITAVFPCEPAAYDGYSMVCYAHIGQHSSCCLEWCRTETVAAKPEEYADLKRELESAPFGYRFKVYKRMQPWMRKALRTHAQRLRTSAVFG